MFHFCYNVLVISVFLWRNQQCCANTTVSGNELHVETYVFFNVFWYYLYICKWRLTVLAVWWWCGVCQRVSAENMGPMQQAEISRAKTNTSHKQVSRRYKTYWSIVSLSVAKYYRIAWLTVQCWRSWRCSLHSNLKQEIQIFWTPPLKKRKKSLHWSCI